MTMLRTATDCPDGVTCPAKWEGDDDPAGAYVVGTVVTDPAILAQLRDSIGADETVVRIPRSLWGR